MTSKKMKDPNSTSSLAENHTKDICLAIMPFDGWFDEYYIKIYCPAIKAANLEPFRTDDLYRPSMIINDIWSYTKKAKLILADLSGKNPNVFYELGLAHGIAKPVILISESINDVPFDLRALRVILYDKNNPDWGLLLKNNIINSIKEVLQSPLEAVLPAFLNVDAKSKTINVSEQEKAILEMRNEIDVLKRELLSTSSRDFRFAHTRLSDYEVDAKFEDLMRTGSSFEKIAMIFSKYGYPIDWTRRKYENYFVARDKPIPKY
ncbi:MAG: hypothetical protein C0401_05925 [Anaerolinea sp.]|nr:hypothetical protein [Anaerolinea sp.]